MSTALAIPSPTLVSTGSDTLDTNNVLTGGATPLNEYDVSDAIYLKNGRPAPFTWFLQSIGVGNGYDTTHRWYEDEMVPQRDTINGSVASGAATLVVDNVGRWTVRDIIWEPTSGAQGVVTAITAGTSTLTVTWIGAAVIPDGRTVIRIGNSYAEDSTLNLGPSTKEVEKTNYFQDARHGKRISDLQAANPVRVKQKRWDYQMQKAQWQHQREIEKSLLFGQASRNVAGDTPYGVSRGLYNFLSTNTTSVGAVLTRAVWETFVTDIVAKNQEPTQNWVAFVSHRIRIDISGFSTTYERTDTSKKQFGMAIEDYKCPDGTIVKLVTHPMFHHEGLDGLGFLINMSPDVVKLYYHTHFQTKRYKSLLERGRSSMEEFYRTVFTLEVKGEDINGGKLTNVA